MESLTELFFICFGMFFLFFLYEFVKIRKSINKLDGIVKHLLKQEKNKSEDK